MKAAYDNQQDKIQHLEAFINRFRAQATKAKQVQSRIKELEKIERIEIPPDEETIHFRFPQPKASGRVVAEFSNVSKSYGEKFVFGNATFSSSAATAWRWSASTGRGSPRSSRFWPAPSRSRAANIRWATMSSPITSRRINTRNSIPTPA